MNATELIADIKRKAQLQSDQDTLTDADILDLATKELQTVIVPKILAIRENFFSTYKDFVLSSVRAYRIPTQATGSKILEVEIVSGADTRGIVQLDMFDRTGREGFFIRSGSVVLTNNAPATGTLRIHYSARPGVLTETNKTVSAVTSTTVTTSVAHGYLVGGVLSFQKASSPFEFVDQDDVVLTVPLTTTLTMTTATDPSASISIGDSVTISNTGVTASTIQASQSLCFYPQLPIELHDWLAYRTALRVLEHLGHSDLYQLKQAKLGDIEKDIMALLSPRVNNQPKVIANFDLVGNGF